MGPENLIRKITKLRRFIDCHGNPAFERAIATLFREGVIRRHLKKALQIYRARRDHFCKLLESELSAYCTSEIPEGGLADWVQFENSIPLDALRKIAVENGLVISRTVIQNSDGQKINAIRMGCASINEKELTEAVSVLKTSILMLLQKPN